jgi:hypothetical protein
MTKIIGEYYAEYDDTSALYCVFHTDINSGHAYSSWATMEEAEQAAKDANYLQSLREED